MQNKKTGRTVERTYHQIIEKTDFSNQRLKETEFESVEFRGCTFTDISGFGFSDCLFNSCNLSNVAIAKSKMQNVKFSDCKLIGINFFQTSDFGFTITFENCLLDYASFDHKKMNKSTFINCRLHGANFTQTDLSKSVMENCDLLNAVFSATNMTGMDFTTNYNFTIDPVSNLIKKTKFSASNLAGLLSVFDIIVQ